LPLTHHVEGRSAMRKRLVVLLMATMMVLLTASPAFAAGSENVRKRVRPIDPERTPCIVSTQAVERAPQCAAGA
jgi:hypothetical protein